MLEYLVQVHDSWRRKFEVIGEDFAKLEKLERSLPKTKNQAELQRKRSAISRLQESLLRYSDRFFILPAATCYDVDRSEFVSKQPVVRSRRNDDLTVGLLWLPAHATQDRA